MASVSMTQVMALILRAVAAGHRYGFDVMERCALPSGTVYPALRRLDRAGLLVSGWEDEEAAHAEVGPGGTPTTHAGRAVLPEADAKLTELRRVLRGLPAPGPGAAALIGAALLASWLPARRASRVDPLEALRADRAGARPVPLTS